MSDKMVLISIISLLSTIAIAVATWFYTIYSRRTINELKRQNDFLIAKNESDYILIRK